MKLSDEVEREQIMVEDKIRELKKKLKNNKLMPIQVTQIQVNKKISKGMRKQKKNVESSDSVLKAVREKEIEKKRSN